MKNATKKTSRKGSKAASKGTKGVRRPVGKIVDTLSPAQLKGEIDALLNDLHNAKTRNEKKGIRRALRTRNYFISREGGGLTKRVVA